ncbi:MAG: hypothetical protein J7K90_05050 [Desulfuromusa sp.]|nr:hypothetical protein [Desulfuromusa sp.]
MDQHTGYNIANLLNPDSKRATVTERHSNSNVRLIFLLAGFLLLCAGLPSAFGCLLPENQTYSPEIRVDGCHQVINQKALTPCCQSKACHQTAPRKRDLGSPEYHTQLKNSHSLVHESRPLTPKLKVGKPFLTKHIILPQFSSLARDSQTPLQSLHSLRTIVLLN